MAVGNASLASYSEALKRIYSNKDVRDEVYKISPLLGLMKKVPDFYGDDYSHTVQTGVQQGIGATIAAALENKSSNNYKRFTVQRKRVYGVGSIEREVMLASKSDKGSVVKALEAEQKGLIKGIKRHLSASVFGNGGASLGQITAVGGTTITVDLSVIRNFEVDQKLAVSATDGLSGATRAPAVAGVYPVITAVNRRTGVITLSAAIGTTITGATTGDYLFLNGTFGADFAGLAAWVPVSDPTSTLFFGVDRSIDPTRLAGQRYDGAGGPMEEVLQYALAQAATEDCEADVIVMNPLDVAKLTVAMGSRTTYDRRTASDAPSIGYKTVKIIGPGGESDIISDAQCPKGRAWILTLSDWTFHTLEELPHYVNEDGGILLRDPTTDTFTWRMAAYGNITCDKPSQQMAVVF